MLRLAVTALAIGCIGAIAIAQRLEAIEQLARVRLVVTTTAASASIAVTGATVASYLSTVDSGPPTATVSRIGALLQLSRNVAGQTAEATFDVVLADVARDATIAWNLTTDTRGDTQIAVYALDGVSRATLVDRFSSAATSAVFSTASTRVAATPLRTARFGPPLVLAHYYPWYDVDTWSDPQMADRPLRLYSTESQPDVNAEALTARAAGIDAWVVSWQGLEAGSGFNDRRMRIALAAAAAAGMRACAYTETYVANPGNDPSRPIDPRTLLDWLADLVDRYGGHPAYLRVGGRPVILTYAASLLPAADWAEVIARLKSSGRNPLLIGDFARSPLLDAFDGEYQYSNVFSSGDALAALDLAESLRVRTFNLLRPGDLRRVWVASVTPGFDDSHLVARATPRIVDRAAGAVYADQWSKAIDTGADWVVVTSWNEWWENTEIEPGVRYGRAYLDATRQWAQAFKESSRIPASAGRQ
jgi:glycosyl hydrolase family 99